MLFVFPFSVIAGKKESALRVAVLNKDASLVQKAIDDGANINYVQDDYTDNALGLSVSAGQMQLVEVLLKNGANPNIHIDGNGVVNSTALLKAIAAQNLPIVKALIAGGANVNLPSHFYYKPNEQMTSPLMMAIAAPYTKDSMAIFDLLLQSGANVNFVNSKGETALMIASNGNYSIYHKQGVYYMAEKLLLKGADKSIRNKEGRSAQDIAAESNFSQMVDLFRQKRFNK